MAPAIVIIDSNTLNCMALRSIITDMLPGINIIISNSIDNYDATDCMIVHYFVGAEIVFYNLEHFKSIANHTIVIVNGKGGSFDLSGFRTIDISLSESEIVSQILRMHQLGHPMGHSPEKLPAEKEKKSLLSQREKDVLKLIVKGLYNKEIADNLNISIPTVIFHRNNIAEKLGTRSIGHLTVYAVVNKIVDLDELC